MAATTLDDVWFPLIKKKGLSKKPVAAQASMSSDLSARYKIIPRSSQVTQAMEVSISPRWLLHFAPGVDETCVEPWRVAWCGDCSCSTTTTTKRTTQQQKAEDNNSVPFSMSEAINL